MIAGACLVGRKGEGHWGGCYCHWLLLPLTSTARGCYFHLLRLPLTATATDCYGQCCCCHQVAVKPGLPEEVDMFLEQAVIAVRQRGDEAGGDEAGGDEAGGDEAGGDEAGGDEAGGDEAGE